MRRTPLRLLLAGLATYLVAAPLPGRADDLPPQEAAPYTAVYKAMTRGKLDPADEKWDFEKNDTVTISVSGTRSRWDHKDQALTAFNDYAAKTITEIGGKLAAGKAVRTTYRQLPIRWELGYGSAARATESKPEVLGTDTIAGHSCTRLKYESAQFGAPEYCVTKDGVVLRFKNASSDAETSYEAVSFTPGVPDPKRFEVPAGLEIKDQRL